MKFLTSATNEYKTRATILENSIHRFHPNDEFINVKPISSIINRGYLEKFHEEKYKHILNLLESQNEPVVYIGADCELFSKLIEIEMLLTYPRVNVILVPHYKKPIASRSHMVQTYTTGMANSDFIVFNNTPKAKEICKWLITVVKDNNGNGEFYDQPWLTSLPFLYKGVEIINHPGYNVGYWDMRDSTFTRDTIDNEPIRFMHYSGFEMGNPEQVSKHSGGLRVTGDLLEIMKDYNRRI